VIAADEAPTDGLFFAHAEHAFWLPVATRSGPDGRFVLAHARGAPLGNVLRASAEGFAPTWRAKSFPGEEAELVLRRGGTLEGRVSSADGGPLADAQLVVVAMEQPTLPRTNFALASTDSEGNYRLENLPPLTMIVVRMQDDDRPDVRPLQMIDGATVRVDFGAPLVAVALEGNLLAADGTPKPLQNLGLFERSSATWNSSWIASTTDSRGRFLFPAVAPGHYLVFLIDALGNQLRCVDELELGTELLHVVRDIHVPASRLEVRVRSAADGAPLGAVGVVLEHLEADGSAPFAALASSNAEGQARLSEQRPGRYRVTAYPTDGRHGYATREEVELGDTPTELEFVLGPGGAALVTVHAADGRALPRASVVFDAGDGREHNFSQVPETDSDGRFRAVGLAPGTYTVRVRMAGFEPVEKRLDFQPGEEALVPVVLSPTAPR
jgi:hypothetical protein